MTSRDPNRAIALDAVIAMDLIAHYLKSGRPNDALVVALNGANRARRRLKDCRPSVPPAEKRRLVSKGGLTQT